MLSASRDVSRLAYIPIGRPNREQSERQTSFPGEQALDHYGTPQVKPRLRATSAADTNQLAVPGGVWGHPAHFLAQTRGSAEADLVASTGLESHRGLRLV